MSIDTVRLSIPVGYMALDKFEYSQVKENKFKGTQQVSFWTTGKNENGEPDPRIPRVTYYPPGSEVNEVTGDVSTGLLSVEASLPKIINGQNYELLCQSEIDTGMKYLFTIIGDYFKVNLPEWRTWGVSRLDGVWSWPVNEDMCHYLNALQSKPVHRYTRTNYISDKNQTQGFSWITRSRKVNAYDKGLESGAPEAKGLLRLEVQNLNSSAVARVCKRLSCRKTAGNLVTENAGKKEVSNWLEDIGMGEEILAKGDIFKELLDRFGVDGASARWFFLDGYKRFGSDLKHQNYSPETYKKRYREAKKQGWLLESEKKLPGLQVG